MKVRDRILARLRESPGEFVKSFALTDLLYPDQPQADALNTLRVHIHKMRKAGLNIESRPGTNSPGYRLVEP